MSILEKTWTYIRNWWYRTESKHLFPKDNVLIGIGGSTKLSANVTTSSPELFIKWQKVTGNKSTNIRTDSIKYSGSSCSMLTPELVINDVDKTDEGAYRLSVTTVTETVTGPKVRLNVFGDPVLSLPKEERNFLRYYLLCQIIATESARLFFIRKVPEPTLAAHLNSYKTNLKFSYWKCTSDQLTALFPASPGVAKSRNFDFTLLYKLIRNTLSPLSTPTRGWGPRPLHWNFKEEDDIERIRHNRNLLAHNTEFKLNDSDFNDRWTDLSQAIVRLSFGSLSVDVVNLSKQKLDTQLKNEIFENLKIAIESMKGEMNILHQDIEECRERIQTIEDTHIPQNIRHTHLKMLKKWTHEDEIYFDKTRVYQATEDMVQSCSIVGLVGGPGCGKTALAKHIALAYEQNGWEVIPVADFDKIVMYGNSKLKQIFVIDDILGVFSVNMNWFNNLNSHQEGILEVLVNGSKLLFTCRKFVYYEAVKLQSFVLEKVIDLESKENTLNDEEKKNILSKHCRFIGVPEDMYCNLSLPSSSLMFPLLCKIFSTRYKTHVNVDKFFAKPFHCLIKELDTMEYRTPTQYAALVLCVLSNNMLSVEKTVDEKEMKLDAFNTCGVNQGTSDKEIKNVVSNLVGTYLIENRNYFTFIHDAIYEIVAYHYGKNNPLIILRYMNNTFIATKVTVDKHKSNNESTNMLTLIDTKHYVQLAEKLWTNLQSFDLFNVFMNKSLHHLPFLNIFIKTMLEKPYNELIDLICHEQFSPKKRLQIYSYRIKENKYSKMHCSEQDRQQLLMNKYTDISVPHNPRTISWIIYYGHTKLLTYIVNLVKENMDSTDIVFGSDIKEQTRILTLGCYSGDPDMVNLILKYVKIGCINNTSFDTTLFFDDYDYGNENRKYTPLTSACDFGNLSVVHTLLKNNAKIDQNDDYDRLPLLCASEQGHIEVVRYLVQKGCNVNQRNIYDETSLHRASYKGHLTVVKYLVQKGADVNQCDTKDISPLYKACERGHKAIVEFLVEKGADINQCDTIDTSPLYAVCESGHKAIVEFLVEKGADVNQCSTYEKSPLYNACEKGHTAVVEFLVEKGADINQCDTVNPSPLYKACEIGHKAIVEFLVEKGADVNQCDKHNETPLYKACERGHTAIVEFLVEKGADVNQCSTFFMSPLYTACAGGHNAVVKFLVDKGADVNKCNERNEPPLFGASSGGHFDVVKLLVQKGANVNQCSENNRSSLHLASYLGHIKVVELLLQNGADVNKCNTNAESSLHKATKGGHFNVIKYLVQQGANVDQQNTDEETPLYKASRHGQLDIVECLVQNGADVNQLNKYRDSPLSSAARSFESPLNVVQYLVNKGANVNQCSESNKSPLYWASYRGHIKVVELLLQNGADVNKLSTDNESPLYQASEKRHYNVVKYLVENGADVNQCNKDNKSPLYESCKRGNAAVVEFLLEYRANVNQLTKHNESPLFKASTYGHVDIVEMLVQKGAVVNQCNTYDESSLYKASKGGYLNVVEYLVQNGANVNQCNKPGETPLFITSTKGYDKVVECLVQNGADVNQFKKNKEYPLCSAARSLKFPFKVVQCLVNKGANVNQCSESNKSSLYWASGRGDITVVDFLLQNGAEVNKCSKYSESPLYKACEGGHYDVVECLVQNGADVNQCNADNETPLYKAVEIEYVKMVAFLIGNKADVTVRTQDGISPLRLAVWLNFPDIATELMKTENKIIPFSGNHHLFDILSDLRKTVLFIDGVVLDGSGTKIKQSLSQLLLNVINVKPIRFLEHLIKLGLNVNQCNNEGQSLLEELIESPRVLKKYRKLELLIQNGADLTVRDGQSLSMLGKMRKFLKKSQDRYSDIYHLKESMQTLKKHMRRNSV